ncbi:conserved hypothetical Ustilaginaceae-specific protein [Sporisorium reilianum SRZ2]|uniref:Conserved hypothetical Ustilaginaceae-specific protein n=1 Tax=Sporisorium reilianum (strain SRZ2) TaxID=999809 RepID=E6ZVY7_SPORE|nr:conserved hypothetical Ustilaginaceae-specific protein [Sporisorium reilianum SRZ2]
MVKDVREQKQLHLKATGANFEEEESARLLHNLVDLYNSSSTKLAFLKPDCNTSLPTASQLDLERQKRKHAVSIAREAGLMGQTLALKRMCDRPVSITSSEATDPESQEVLGNDEELDSPSPLQKRRQTSKAHIGEKLVSGLNKLIDIHASALDAGSSQPHVDKAESIKSEVGQLRSDVEGVRNNLNGLNKKVDMMLQMLMQQRGLDPSL